MLFRRRREDWGGRPRADTDDPLFAERRNALTAASATLEADYALTAAHSDDVVSLSEAIAERLGVNGGERAAVLAAAALHDIGKVTIPQELIDKPGALASHEWEVVRRHTLAGERIIRTVPEMEDVAELVRWSHERWDGLGYPDGLTGDKIPLGSRIIFCADAYHAIRCDRPYRPGRSAEAALAELRDNAGTQFDPYVVEALDEVARRLRSSRRVRLRALAGGVRSRRVALLLLVLSISGSAAAATGVGPFKPLFGSKAATPPVVCAPGGCLPAELGPLGQPFPPALARASTRGAASRSASRARRAAQAAPGAAAPSSGTDGSGGSGGSGGSTTSHETNGGGGNSSAGSVPTGGSSGPAHSKPTHSGRPPSPGRSEQAPGRPEQTGKPPKTGAPGRSEEAPGKPDSPPGQFGKGQHGH